MEKLDRDKHSSLLRKLVNYDRKKFYNIRPSLKFAGKASNLPKLGSRGIHFKAFSYYDKIRIKLVGLRNKKCFFWSLKPTSLTQISLQGQVCS
jgi:hypothetical protein